MGFVSFADVCPYYTAMSDISPVGQIDHYGGHTATMADMPLGLTCRLGGDTTMVDIPLRYIYLSDKRTTILCLH